MAKKYLLYIHDELFEKEGHKSQLVNNLLERHYHDTVGGKTQNEILEVIKTRQDAVKAIFPKAERLCKHGYSLESRLCKFGCR